MAGGLLRILGIDPGSRKIGFGLISCSGRSCEWVDSGTIFLDNQRKIECKTFNIFAKISNIILELQPHVVSLESLVYGKNPTSLIKLSQARGAILAAIGSQPGIKLVEYSPNLIKSTVTGHGHASKSSISKYVSLHLNIQKSFDSDDETDALAIALCHHFSKGLKSKSSKGSLASSLSHKFGEL